MTTTTSATTITTAQPAGLPPDTLPLIDLTTLSQSELRFLSLSTATAAAAPAATNNQTPASCIDRATFNESAGSRRQTYSRPSPHLHHHRHRLAGLLPKAPHPNPTTTNNDPENQSIVKFLKQFLSSHPQFEHEPQLDLIDFNSFSLFNNIAINDPRSLDLVPIGAERKRKRGRKPKLSASVDDSGIVNKNGCCVDLEKLQSLELPYMEELRRRTAGLENEDQLLEFFGALDGEWCSRRKKRKIVDANVFGDLLPVGWKLLLGLRRKEGRAWVYCRRYIRLFSVHYCRFFWECCDCFMQ